MTLGPPAEAVQPWSSAPVRALGQNKLIIGLPHEQLISLQIALITSHELLFLEVLEYRPRQPLLGAHLRLRLAPKSDPSRLPKDIFSSRTMKCDQ